MSEQKIIVWHLSKVTPSISVDGLQRVFNEVGGLQVQGPALKSRPLFTITGTPDKIAELKNRLAGTGWKNEPVIYYHLPQTF